MLFGPCAVLVKEEGGGACGPMYALFSVLRPTGRLDAKLHDLYEGRTQFLMYTEQMNSWGGGGEEAVHGRR